MLMVPRNREMETHLLKWRYNKIRDGSEEKVLGIKTPLGEGVVKEEY